VLHTHRILIYLLCVASDEREFNVTGLIQIVNYVYIECRKNKFSDAKAVYQIEI